MGALLKQQQFPPSFAGILYTSTGCTNADVYIGSVDRPNSITTSWKHPLRVPVLRKLTKRKNQLEQLLY